MLTGNLGVCNAAESLKRLRPPHATIFNQYSLPSVFGQNKDDSGCMMVQEINT